MSSAYSPPPPHASEASRLLCAGTYLDESFRDAVIDELYVHEERMVAPSFGFDAARVLAHALRARRRAVVWTALLMTLWMTGATLSDGLLLAFAPPFALLAAASRLRGTSVRRPEPGRARAVTATVLRWWGRIWLGSVALWLWAIRPEPGPPDSWDGSAGESLFWVPGLSADVGYQPFHGWVVVCSLLSMTLVEAARRGQWAATLDRELSPVHFPDAAADPAEEAIGIRFQRLRQRIRSEQHAPLLLYDIEAPFRGAGVPYPARTYAVSLRPAHEPGFGTREPEPLLNRQILQHIEERLANLRITSERAVPNARDRLRHLTVDECVFLPVEGLPSRSVAPQSVVEFEMHRTSAVEEGGEKRRHFLRVQVRGWDEEVVVTVFVRAHTQGGLVTLEVAPYVLRPVRSAFREADRIAHRQRRSGIVAKAAKAVVRTPETAGYAPLVLWRAAKVAWQEVAGGHGSSLPEGPAVSVRELASERRLSAFQELDVQRYLEAVRQGIVQGMAEALQRAGWRTDEFEARTRASGPLTEPAGRQPAQPDVSWVEGGAV
ncbi:hypothetical protein GCM10010297_17570 [Streptomyces malachitofuscus]|nr:hypothetical protein GCM10010297_17570 [Streptomyces malachitofuscus]